MAAIAAIIVNLVMVVLAAACAGGLAAFVAECIRTAWGRRGPPRAGGSMFAGQLAPCAWPTADEVDRARVDAWRRQAAL